MNTKIVWKPVHPIANLLVKYLRLPDHPIKLRFILAIMKNFFPAGIIVENSYGGKVIVDPEDYIGWSILSQGDYEGETLALATNILKQGGVFLDIGANFGLFTCCLGTLPNVTSYAIEPFAKNFLQLQNNVNLNPKIAVKLFNLALDKKICLLEMEEHNPKNSGTARVSLEAFSLTKKHTVIATTLQNILENSKVEKVDLMKIDVEGYELPILEGLNWDGCCRPRNIIIEFTDYSSRVEGEGKKTILDFLISSDYQGMTIDGKPLTIEKSILEDNAYFRDIRYYQS